MAKKKTLRKTGKKRSNRKTTPRKAAKATSGGRGPAGMSTAELQAELHRRERGLSSLVKKRERAAARLEEIDQEIAALGGAAMGGKRARNDQPLADALVDCLTGTTMSVTEVAEAVQHAGYRTTSPNFRTIVNQTLLKDKRFKRVARGQYTAK